MLKGRVYMRRLMFMMLILLSITSCGKRSNPYIGLEKPFVYPVISDTDEWAALEEEEKFAVCQIPEDVLAGLTTEELLRTVLECPLLTDIRDSGSMAYGCRRILERVNALQELVTRENLDRVVSAFDCEKFIQSLDDRSYAEEMTAMFSFIAEYDPKAATVFVVDGGMLPGMTAELQAEVEAERKNLFWTEGYNDRYYGNYNGTVIFFVGGMTTAIERVEVAGITFEHSNGCSMYAYADGKLYTLQKAYYSGLLTREDLLTALEYHLQYRYVERGAFLAEDSLRDEVEAAWKEKFGSRLRWYRLGGEVRNLGGRDGEVVLFEPTGKKEETTLSVGGVDITWDESFEIHVYKDGEICSLAEAYEKGIVAVDDLKSIRVNHQNMYEQNEEYEEKLRQESVKYIHGETVASVGDGIVQRFEIGTTVEVDLDGDGVKELVTVSLEDHFFRDGEKEVCIQVGYEYFDQHEVSSKGYFFQEDQEYFYVIDMDPSDQRVDIGIRSSGQDGNTPELTLLRCQREVLMQTGKIGGDIAGTEESGSWIRFCGDGTAISRVPDETSPEGYVEKQWTLGDNSKILEVGAGEP